MGRGPVSLDVILFESSSNLVGAQGSHVQNPLMKEKFMTLKRKLSERHRQVRFLIILSMAYILTPKVLISGCRCSSHTLAPSDAYFEDGFYCNVAFIKDQTVESLDDDKHRLRRYIPSLH